MGLTETFSHLIQVEHKLIHSFLLFIEQRIGLKQEFTIYSGFGLLLIYLLFGWNRDILCNLIGFLIPFYASLRTIGSTTSTDNTKWSVYWIIYALFTFIEYFNSTFCRTFRFYWFIKCLILIWFMLPGSWSGVHIIYYQIIRRYIFDYVEKKQKRFYNIIADQSHISNVNSYDRHGNPVNREYDLGRDRAFHGYRILIGQFYRSGDMKAPIQSLELKGFHVDNVQNENDFICKLQSKKYHIVWIISSSTIQDPSFISVLLDFHSSGGSIFLFADNIPYVSHASEFLFRKFGIMLTGNYQGNKTLTFKTNGYQHAGHFGSHAVFTGIRNLFEGVTICHPVYLVPMNRLSTIRTIATATDGNPCVLVYEPDEKSSDGRLCLDCGFTKLFINWNSPGTSRFINNVSCWLAKAEKFNIQD